MDRWNVLFVCSKNRWRSPTAERIYRNDPRLSVTSRGIGSHAARKLQPADLQWADLLFVMEQAHLRRIRQSMRDELSSVTAVVLNIPDDFQFMDPCLVDLLRERIDPQLDAWIKSHSTS